MARCNVSQILRISDIFHRIAIPLTVFIFIILNSSKDPDTAMIDTEYGIPAVIIIPTLLCTYILTIITYIIYNKKQEKQERLHLNNANTYVDLESPTPTHT
jgi:hypothetical protein